MSDAADPPQPGPDREPEELETWTDSGAELEMTRGDAYNLAAETVVWVDARCVGCERSTVTTVPDDGTDWLTGKNFADYCRSCSMLSPHYATRTLTGLNRRHDRGRVQRGDTDGQ